MPKKIEAVIDHSSNCQLAILNFYIFITKDFDNLEVIVQRRTHGRGVIIEFQ